MKSIKDLFGNMDYKLVNLKPDTGVKGISADSRTIKRGEMFIAIDGPEHNGYDYIEDALKKGARALCVDRPQAADKSLGIILVRDTAKAFPILASRIYNEPSKSVRVIGVTGTNGKTTIGYLMHEILKAANKKPSLLGTVIYKINDKTVKSSNTTPGPLLLHSLLAEMRDSGSDYAIMEVSSHALKQARVFGVDFKVAIMTNITGDHLDYHKTMDDYAKSKRILFESLGPDSAAVLNKDDSFYDYFRKATKAKVLDYGIQNRADFTAKDIKSDISGSSFLMDTPIGPVKIKTPLMGRHNVYNILAAASASFAEGISLDTVSKALGGSISVPGRLEAVSAGQPFRIFVDYAHTHDALEKILSELRPLCKGKLVAVFGCGGDRDKTKRPKMGRIASEIADEVILTNDNPRTEDPEIILNEIESGMKKSFKKYKRIPDRFEAIKESLKGRDKDDVVVIAGKGHEDCQVIGKEIFPFSDRKAVEKILKQAG
ncbi:MAG: UDP-N-acetylmuramoyl-L-alanyl-D-glutamate--2,6-diaminopimelate ligase [Candidatus Omnitrophota bacterium]|nr:UDP-N-acetylmuramoyl-L-alanyl-D-glutamate--2,6-diaminopimelate ligase [Candidatus Omnitrophota bacterium]